MEKSLYLKPEEWMFQSISEAQLLSKMSEVGDKFRVFGDYFINYCIKRVVREQSYDGGKDNIDLLLSAKERADSYKKCITCGSEANADHRTCRCCGESVKKEFFRFDDPNLIGEDIDPYESFRDYPSSFPDISC